MEIFDVKVEDGKLTFSLANDGTNQDFFDLQGLLLRELLQQRATMKAQSRLLMDLVAEVRHEDLIDVEARFENWQKDYLTEYGASLKKGR